MGTTATAEMPVDVKGRPIPTAYPEGSPRQKKLRISHGDAVDVMMAAGLEPLTTFHGASENWECRCLECGLVDTHVYSFIKNGTDKGCRDCNPKSYPGRAKSVDAKAVALMEEAGFTPLVPYPGTSRSWLCICSVCHEEKTPKHHAISRRSAGRIGCAECCKRGPSLREPAGARDRMLVAGFEPLDPWPGNSEPWRSRCKNCRDICYPKYKGVSNVSGLGCRTCSQDKQQRSGRIEPAVAIEEMRAFGLEPLTPFTTSGARWECRCLECGETVFRTHQLVRKGTAGACKHDALRLAEAMSGMEEAQLSPLEPFPGEHQRWRSKCQICKRVESPMFKTIRGRTVGKGCSRCASSLTDPGEAERMMLTRGIRPLGPYPGRQSALWAYKCVTCKYEGARSFFSLKNREEGCHSCAGEMFEGEAVALMEKCGYEPLVPFPGSDNGWLSRCQSCGGTTSPTYNRIKSRPPRRAKCSEHMTGDELAARMIAAGFTPTAPYPGRTAERWPSRCNRCHADVAPTYRGIMLGGGAGCCGGPFDLRRPGRTMAVYLVINEEMNAAKVGIALTINGRTNRVSEHRRNGWTEHRTYTGFPSLAHALDVERVIINGWRDGGLGPHLTQAQMPQDGYTETVQLDLIELDEVAAYIESELAERCEQATPETAKAAAL